MTPPRFSEPREQPDWDELIELARHERRKWQVIAFALGMLAAARAATQLRAALRPTRSTGADGADPATHTREP
jgi:hypothetical protein